MAGNEELRENCDSSNVREHSSASITENTATSSNNTIEEELVTSKGVLHVATRTTVAAATPNTMMTAFTASNEEGDCLRARRLEQNRKTAKKRRDRQRQYLDDLQMKETELKHKNDCIKSENEMMQTQRNKLLAVIQTKSSNNPSVPLLGNKGINADKNSQLVNLLTTSTTESPALFPNNLPSSSRASTNTTNPSSTNLISALLASRLAGADRPQINQAPILPPQMPQDSHNTQLLNHQLMTSVQQENQAKIRTIEELLSRNHQNLFDDNNASTSQLNPSNPNGPSSSLAPRNLTLQEDQRRVSGSQEPEEALRIAIAPNTESRMNTLQTGPRPGNSYAPPLHSSLLLSQNNGERTRLSSSSVRGRSSSPPSEESIRSSLLLSQTNGERTRRRSSSSQEELLDSILQQQQRTRALISLQLGNQMAWNQRQVQEQEHLRPLLAQQRAQMEAHRTNSMMLQRASTTNPDYEILRNRRRSVDLTDKVDEEEQPDLKKTRY